MGPYAAPARNKHLPPALYAFPSPASITESLSSPTLDKTLPSNLTPSTQHTPYYGPYEAAGVVPTEPGSTRSQPLMSPPVQESTECEMNLIVGGALAPTTSKQSVRPSPRAGPGLRLPSFDELGIAAPHPDRLGVDSLDRTFSQAARDAMQEPYSAPHLESSLGLRFQDLKIGHSREDAGACRSAPPSMSPAGGTRMPFPHFVDVLTPPAERHEPEWRLALPTITAPLHSPATDPGAPALPEDNQTLTAENTSTVLPSRPAPEASHPAQPREWYDGAVDALCKHPEQHHKCKVPH